MTYCEFVDNLKQKSCKKTNDSSKNSDKCDVNLKTKRCILKKITKKTIPKKTSSSKSVTSSEKTKKNLPMQFLNDDIKINLLLGTDSIKDFSKFCSLDKSFLNLCKDKRVISHKNELIKIEEMKDWMLNQGAITKDYVYRRDIDYGSRIQKLNMRYNTKKADSQNKLIKLTATEAEVFFKDFLDTTYLKFDGKKDLEITIKKNNVKKTYSYPSNSDTYYVFPLILKNLKKLETLEISSQKWAGTFIESPPSLKKIIVESFASVRPSFFTDKLDTMIIKYPFSRNEINLDILKGYEKKDNIGISRKKRDDIFKNVKYLLDENGKNLIDANGTNLVQDLSVLKKHFPNYKRK